MTHDTGLNRDGLLELPLDPPEPHPEDPCFDCAGEGAALSLYDHLTQDLGFAAQYSVKNVIASLREVIRDECRQQTCERHSDEGYWRRGGES